MPAESHAPPARTTTLASVLLPCRDAARHLPAALAGIEAQRYRPIELIAVDDGSTDSTGDILRAFQEGRSWVRVLRTEGVGEPSARALAFAASNGEWVAIHDADDVSYPDRLTRQVEYLQTHPDVGVLGTAADVIDEGGSRIGKYPLPLRPKQISRMLRRAPPFVHGSVMMRRDAYVAAGGYRAPFRTSCDYDLWLRIPGRYRLHNLPEPLYAWRRHPGTSFAKQRDLHLEYLPIARAFADERTRRGEDSVRLLLEIGNLGAFRTQYPDRKRLALYRGEALVREGRVAEARSALVEVWQAGPPESDRPRAIRDAITALAWWLLSWPVALTPRARLRRSEERLPAARSGTAA